MGHSSVRIPAKGRLIAVVLLCSFMSLQLLIILRRRATAANVDDAQIIASTKMRQPATFDPSLPSGVTWIGNAWILPPHFRMFSSQEMQDHFSNKNVIWIGDSEMIAMYASLYEILQTNLTIAPHPSKNVLGNNTIINSYTPDGSCSNHVKSFPKEKGICRSNGKKRFDFIELDCLEEVRHLLYTNLQNRERNQWSRHYALLIIGTGRLELHKRPIKRRPCMTPTTMAFPNGIHQRLQSLMDTLSKFPFHGTIVWRTGMFAATQTLDQSLQVDHLSKSAMQRMMMKPPYPTTTSYRVVDYGDAAASRAFALYPDMAVNRLSLFHQLLMNELISS